MAIRIDGTNTTANPGISGADTDTGLQIGTDELSLVTGGSARATVDSSGRVGIGTSSPGDYSGAATKFTVAGSDNSGLNIVSGTSSAGIIRFADGSSGDAAYRGRVEYMHDVDALMFGTAGSERLRIDSSGNVGIGTTSPNSKLTLSTGDKIFVPTGEALNFGHTDGSTNTERMRIDSSGNVGIGTTSPSTAITQFGAGAKGLTVSQSQPAVALEDTTGSTYAYFGLQNNNAYVDNLANGFLRFATNSTERMRITNGGQLQLADASAFRAKYIYDTTTSGSASVYVSPLGYLYRSTSSLKYKTNVETLQDKYADALLNCRPVWYQSTSQVDNPDWGHWGFIAEEVAEIDPRLVHWKTTEVTYDENGSAVETPCDPEPEGVQYDRFVPHLLNLIKRQQQAIETLEAKVATLEAAS